MWPRPDRRRRFALRSVGRPRNPRVDQAIKDDAVELYGEVGWAGFSFEAVARRSGVGKPAVYLRWESKQQLIVESVVATRPSLIAPQVGDLKAELLDIAGQLFDTWTSPFGPAWTRLQVEHRSIPELGALYQARTLDPLEESVRLSVDQAVRRGEIPRSVSTRLLLSTIAGSIMARVLNTPVSHTKDLIATKEHFLAGLIELVMHGVQPVPVHSTTSPV